MREFIKLILTFVFCLAAVVIVAVGMDQITADNKEAEMPKEDECIIAYLEARRDMQGWSDAEWHAATAVIDWLRAQFDEIARKEGQP